MDEGLPVAREIYAGILNVGRAAWRHVPLRESKISVGLFWASYEVLYPRSNPLHLMRFETIRACLTQSGHSSTIKQPARRQQLRPRFPIVLPKFFWISEGRFSCGNTHRLTRLSETQGSITMLPITWASPSIRRMINTSPDRVPRPVRAEMFTWCDTSISLPPVS